MIETALILAAAVFTLAEFWEETVNFLKKTIKKQRKSQLAFFTGLSSEVCN